MLPKLSRFTLPIAILIAALAAYRAIVICPEQPSVVVTHDEPNRIAPRFADERVVTDEQLLAVLARVKPPAGPAHTNNYVHALRLWGPNAEFNDKDVPTGRDLQNYFLDDATFRRLAGDAAPPLFYRGKTGLEVRGYDDRTTDRVTSSFHTDDLLATLAEIGTPLTATIALRDGQATVRDLLETSLARFQLEQFEYEWTAIAYARYVFPQTGWSNKFGEKITADALATEIVSHPPQFGPCNGLHRLEALAVLYRADEHHRALRPKTRLKLLAYMKQSSDALVAAQSADGFWTREWSLGAPPSPTDQPSLHDKLLVTGHHLEWLALAPEDVQPPRETIVRAAQWLARTLVELDEQTLIEAYGPYTHAARALSLWRGAEAFDFWQTHHNKSLVTGHLSFVSSDK